MAVKKEKRAKDTGKGMVEQQIKMAPEERQAVARKMKEEYYGKRLPDVRDF
jgi:hypothetical protein